MGRETEVRNHIASRNARRWVLTMIVVSTLAGVGVISVVSRPQPSPLPPDDSRAAADGEQSPAVEIPRVPFVDVTQAAGIRFHHENGARGEKLLPETMGGGCAFFDFDGDGDQDLLLVNSRHWPGPVRDDESSPPVTALYRNDGTGRFDDVTAGSGLDVSMYGMGAAVGDYDNDGRSDVFLSALGRNRLFHNEGSGKFREVTDAAGVGGNPTEWSTSCGWFDYDRDGDLDLFVCNYLQWSREYDAAQNFRFANGRRAYGRPQNFEGAFSYLYRNEGDGQFADVSADAGLQVGDPETGAPMGKSLGVTFADFDRDGWMDIIVANDTVQNFLFRNQHDGTFVEVGALAGVAFDMNGNPRGAMGIDVSQFRNNTAVGIAIGNFSNEMTALYVSAGSDLQFADVAVSTGVGPETQSQLTFGLFYVDCDLDGRLDLFAANGHLEYDIQRVQPHQTYAQPPQLFWNRGSENSLEFVPVTAAQCGADLLRPIVGRGASYADIDADGDLDLLITTVGGRPRLLRNDQQLGHHWLRFRLRGNRSNRDGIGATVAVKLADHTLFRSVMPTRSYLSQVELPVTFGLGKETHVESVIIYWSDGTSQRLTDITADRTYEVEQAAARLSQ